MTTASAVAEKLGSRELRREVGLIGLAWASMGSIIGSGWLLGAKRALVIAGPSAVIGWGIGAVAIIILALIHAELGGMYPVSGGTARFPHFAFGGSAGASYGWFSWLQAATVAPIEVLATIGYMTHFSWASGYLKTNGALSGSGLLVAIALMAVFVVVNMMTVKWLAYTNSTLTWWKIAIPVLTVIVLLTKFHGGNFTAGGGFAPGGTHGVFSAVASGGIVFALLGFEQADQLAGESANPKRDIPIAIIGSIVVGAIIYIMLQVAFIGALPHSLIPSNWTNPNSTLAGLTGPFATVSTAVALGWLATLLYIDAVISPSGTGLIYTTATSRVSYGLSRNGYFPRAFELTTKQRVPWFGLIVSFVAGCVIFLPFPSWNNLVNLITSISVLMYGGAPLALGALRQKMPHANRPYSIPAASILAPVGFIVANLLILWADWNTYWKMCIAIAIGYFVLLGTHVFKLNPVKPKLHLESSWWIPLYLVGMGVIIELSSFGHNPTNPVLDFGWDALVVAIWSLIIYYTAVHHALSSDEIAVMVEDTVIAEDSLLEEGLPAA
jgi:amino acid transporter